MPAIVSCLRYSGPVVAVSDNDPPTRKLSPSSPFAAEDTTATVGCREDATSRKETFLPERCGEGGDGGPRQRVRGQHQNSHRTRKSRDDSRLSRLDSLRHKLALLDRDSQLAQVLLRHFARSVAHQIRALRGLGERNHLANRRLARQDHHQSIQPQRNSAMRRRTVLQSLEQKSETLLRFLVAESQRAENFRLDVTSMNTN